MKNVKLPYEVPELEITQIYSEDIIITSPLKDEDDGDEYSPVYPL